MKSQKHPSDQRVTPPRFTLIKSMACGLALLASGQAWAATYSQVGFAGLTGSSNNDTTPVAGTISNANGSGVGITVAALSGFVSGAVLGAPANFAVPQSSALTFTFSEPVTNVKLYIKAVSYNATSVDEYLHTFKVNGSTLTTLPAVVAYSAGGAEATVTLSSVTTGGSNRTAGTAPAALPAYSGGPTDNGGGIITFPGASITSVGYTAQTVGSTGATGVMVIAQIDFDYTPAPPAPPVSAPIFSTKEKPAVFSEEVK